MAPSPLGVPAVVAPEILHKALGPYPAAVSAETPTQASGPYPVAKPTPRLPLPTGSGPPLSQAHLLLRDPLPRTLGSTPLRRPASSWARRPTMLWEPLPRRLWPVPPRRHRPSRRTGPSWTAVSTAWRRWTGVRISARTWRPKLWQQHR